MYAEYRSDVPCVLALILPGLGIPSDTDTYQAIKDVLRKHDFTEAREDPQSPLVFVELGYGGLFQDFAPEATGHFNFHRFSADISTYTELRPNYTHLILIPHSGAGLLTVHACSDDRLFDAARAVDMVAFAARLDYERPEEGPALIDDRGQTVPLVGYFGSPSRFCARVGSKLSFWGTEDDDVNQAQAHIACLGVKAYRTVEGATHESIVYHPEAMEALSQFLSEVLP